LGVLLEGATMREGANDQLHVVGDKRSLKREVLQSMEIVAFEVRNARDHKTIFMSLLEC
jgi:hypothetical protein